MILKFVRSHRTFGSFACTCCHVMLQLLLHILIQDSLWEGIKDCRETLIHNHFGMFLHVS